MLVRRPLAPCGCDIAAIVLMFCAIVLMFCAIVLMFCAIVLMVLRRYGYLQYQDKVRADAA